MRKNNGAKSKWSEYSCLWIWNVDNLAIDQIYKWLKSRYFNMYQTNTAPRQEIKKILSHQDGEQNIVALRWHNHKKIQKKHTHTHTYENNLFRLNEGKKIHMDDFRPKNNEKTISIW